MAALRWIGKLIWTVLDAVMFALLVLAGLYVWGHHACVTPLVREVQRRDPEFPQALGVFAAMACPLIELDVIRADNPDVFETLSWGRARDRNCGQSLPVFAQCFKDRQKDLGSSLGPDDERRRIARSLRAFTRIDEQLAKLEALAYSFPDKTARTRALRNDMIQLLAAHRKSPLRFELMLKEPSERPQAPELDKLADRLGKDLRAWTDDLGKRIPALQPILDGRDPNERSFTDSAKAGVSALLVYDFFDLPQVDSMMRAAEPFDDMRQHGCLAGVDNLLHLVPMLASNDPELAVRIGWRSTDGVEVVAGPDPTFAFEDQQATHMAQCEVRAHGGGLPLVLDWHDGQALLARDVVRVASERTACDLILLDGCNAQRDFLRAPKGATLIYGIGYGRNNPARRSAWSEGVVVARDGGGTVFPLLAPKTGRNSEGLIGIIGRGNSAMIEVWHGTRSVRMPLQKAPHMKLKFDANGEPIFTIPGGKTFTSYLEAVRAMERRQ